MTILPFGECTPCDTVIPYEIRERQNVHVNILWLNLKGKMMELILERLYFPNGTNGRLTLNNKWLGYTIELPWKQNKRQISCIPEGTYPLSKRFSKKYGWHFEINRVFNRSLILIHPANNALRELQGCIAPVLQLTGQGQGINSRKACNQLKALLYPLLEQQIEVMLTIKTAQNEQVF